MTVTSTQYAFTATVTSEDDLTASAAQSFTVTSGGGTSPTTGTPGIMGCTVQPGSTGGSLGSTIDAANTTWGNMVEPVQAVKIYYNTAGSLPGPFPQDGSTDPHMQACIDQGLQACVLYYPEPDGSNLTALIDSITSLQSLLEANGGSIEVGLYNEVNRGDAGGGVVTASVYQTAMSNYAPEIRKHCPLVFQCLTGNARLEAAIATYWPGPPNMTDVMVDGVVEDYYATGYRNGFTLDKIQGYATTYSLKLGLWEFGVNAGGFPGTTGNNCPKYVYGSQWTAFTSYISSVAQAQLKAGLDLDAFIWFQSNSGNPDNMITAAAAPFTAANSGGNCEFTLSGNWNVFQDQGLILTGGSLPGGFTAGTTYYVVSLKGSGQNSGEPGGPSQTFQLSSSEPSYFDSTGNPIPGSPMPYVSSGSGTLTDFRIAGVQAVNTAITIPPAS